MDVKDQIVARFCVHGEVIEQVLARAFDALECAAVNYGRVGEATLRARHADALTRKQLVLSIRGDADAVAFGHARMVGRAVSCTATTREHADRSKKPEARRFGDRDQ